MSTAWTDNNPVFLDFETQSPVDIKECGGRVYARSPLTRILSLVSLIDGVYHCWFPHYAAAGDPDEQMMRDTCKLYGIDRDAILFYGTPETPKAIVDAAKSGRSHVAHNAFGFDRHVWDRFIGISVPWADTLYLAKAAGMPGKLDTLGSALLKQGKDSAKRIAMTFTRCAANGAYPQPNRGEAALCLRYNLVDVKLLRDLWYGPFESLRVEEDVVNAHNVVNSRGVVVDTALYRKLKDVARESVKRAGETIERITTEAGCPLPAAKLRSTPVMKAWLESQGVRITNHDGKHSLRKDVVEQHLAQPERMVELPEVGAAMPTVAPIVFDVLRLRSAALRITQAKADRALLRVDPIDGRVRDLFSYHQAHTGRWSSSGLQVHNLPRAKKGVDSARLLAMHESGEWSDGVGGFDTLATLIPSGSKLTVDDLLSALVRPSIVAGNGKTLLIADYAAVECRGIAWIADEKSLLDTFASGGDVYCEMATRIFGRTITKADDKERQVGKVTVLGAGYSMSAEKFALYCALQGIDLAASGTTAELCIEAFRGAYPAIAGTPAGMIAGRSYRRGGVWHQLQEAAYRAVTHGGAHVAGKTAWTFDGNVLYCELPSGRRLHYRNARIEQRIPGYCATLGIEARPKDTLIYANAHGGEGFLYGGKIAENVVQALCRDLLAAALVECERAGIPIVLHVHDELVAEVDTEHADTLIRELARIMSTPPKWADGFPVGVSAYYCKRYLKSPPHGQKELNYLNGAQR